jgi:DNA-binding transcriptional ArsR family regulator
MKYGPDISIVADLMGDPSRSNMVMALMSGLSLSAAELAREAGVTPSTATGHLNKLTSSGLITSRRQGRYRYFHIADPDVAHMVEALVTVAARVEHLRARHGPKDEAMRHARSCYDHLAGRLAVDLFERWIAYRVLHWRGELVQLTECGRTFLNERGIDVATLESDRRPLCRTCIDWSERRHHLGGAIGAEALTYAVNQGWATREPCSRAVSFSLLGEKRFVRWYSS